MLMRDRAHGRYTKRTSSVSGEGNGSSAATAAAPMLTRRGGEDVLIAFTIP